MKTPSFKTSILYEITDQLYAINSKTIGQWLLTILIFPLLAIGWVFGFLWFLIRGVIAVLIVGFKKGNRK